MEKYIPNSSQKTPTEYKTRLCDDCGKPFMKPGNWRKTKRCPTCALYTNEYKEAARKISKSIIENEGYPTTCEFCGKESTGLQIHHIVPLEKGGGPGRHNLAVICITCHQEAHHTEWHK